jgi:dTDP-glucose 4,6-dehydratase
MKLLVTGASGFIGSNFCDLYRAQTNLTTLDGKVFPTNRGREVNYETNILDLAGLCTCLRIEQPTHVLHLAAQTHVDRSITGPYDFIHTNITGTELLMDALRVHCPDLQQFLFVSTDEVYGSVDFGSADEDDKLAPSSPYAASKAGADLLVQAYAKTYNFPAIIVRPTNNFGPFQYHEKLIPLAVKHLCEGKPIPVYGDGENIRDWLFVEDCCAALWTILNSERLFRPGTIYNLAGHNPIRNINLVKRIISHAGGTFEFVKDRPGHDQRYAVNDHKFRTEFGWKPTTDFDQALPATVDYYVQKFANKSTSTP